MFSYWRCIMKKKSFSFFQIFFEHRYLIVLYEKFGLYGAIFIVSVWAFLSGVAIIVPVNIIMGGRILTGIVINFIICMTFMPYHLYHVIRLLNEMNLLRKELYEKSTRDELTQAHNRHYFYEVLQTIQNTSSYIPNNTSLLMIDIDDFKKLNDKYGHLVGDEALKILTKESIPLLRSTDIFARYGGDEFICLLPQTSIEHAQEVAKRIKDKISQIRVRVNNEEVIFTTSIGLATANTEMQFEELAIKADQALYKAKHAGKNQISSV